MAAMLQALESDRFIAREQATTELEGLGDLAAQALRKRLQEQPALETRRRIERLLEKLQGPVTCAEKRPVLRAVMVLERIGTVEAQQVLEMLASGAPDARLTQEAKASLERLAKRPATTP
jgi:hypothetical protein